MSQEARTEAPVLQFLSFLVGGEDCAIDLAYVREIVRHEAATRVPRVPACVRGVVNLRGSVVPVIDLAVGLGRPAARVTSQTCLLVVEMPIGGERSVVGLMVDAVSQVLELRPEDVEPPPSFGTAVPAAFLVGVARSQDAFVLLLDLEHLLGEGALLDGTAASGPLPRGSETA
jgi:purine-binding chemotaxis protein CheW